MQGSETKYGKLNSSSSGSSSSINSSSRSSSGSGSGGSSSSSSRKVNQSRYRSEVPRVFQEVRVSRLHDNGTGWW